MRYVIVGNKSYGLFYGQTALTDSEILETRDQEGLYSIRLYNIRHIARWFGKTGGITSLAMFGPCGPKGKESLIGAPAPSALVAGIVNVIDCSDQAVKAFQAIQAVDSK